MRTLPGHDTVGIAMSMNDHGQAVGSSGTCDTSALPPLAYGSHAVLWETDGSVHDLGNLGRPPATSASRSTTTGRSLAPHS
jgi:hypothetical protein